MSSFSSLGSNPSRLVSETHSAKPSSVAANSQHQCEAAVALRDYSNEDILAWLKLVRSARNIEPIPEPYPRGAYLTSSQIQALVALKDCPNDWLETYLVLARLNRNGPTTAPFAPGSSDDSGFSSNLSSFITPSDPSFLEPRLQTEPNQEESSSPGFSAYGRRPPATNDPDLLGHPAVRPVNLNLSTPTENHYWCTVCEVPKSYKDSGSWKKHEKEHETRFVCKLDVAAHESLVDQSPSTKVFSCKRRDIMVNHLNRVHGIAVQAGRDLADQWRFTVEKQAWSCGFCGSLFLDFKDRLRHIDVEHFRKFENMQQWDFNKVIHGLLLQPKLENAWKKRRASLLPWVQPEDLIWTQAFAKNMRPKLEIGLSEESDADRLVDEVYFAGRPKGYLNESALDAKIVFPTGIARAGSLLSPDQYQVVTAPTSGSAPDHSQRRSTMHSTTNIYGNSPFDQSPRRAYDHDSRAAPSMAPSKGQGTHNHQFFHPAQDWVTKSEGGIGRSGFDDALSEIDQGFSWPTSDWNAQ